MYLWPPRREQRAATRGPGPLRKARGPMRGQHGGGQADIGQQHLAAQLASRHQQVARLAPEEGDGQRRPRREAAHRARCAVEAGRHVHRQQRARGGGGERAFRPRGHPRPAPGRRRTPHRPPGRRDATSAGAKGTIGPRQRAAACAASLPGRGGASAATATGQPARSRQPRRDIAVAAIVAGTGEHQRAARAEPRLRRARDGAAGRLHQRGAGDAAGDRRRVGARHLGGGEQFERHGRWASTPRFSAEMRLGATRREPQRHPVPARSTLR